MTQIMRTTGIVTAAAFSGLMATAAFAEENTKKSILTIQPIESYDVLKGPEGMNGIPTPQEFFSAQAANNKSFEGAQFDQDVLNAQVNENIKNIALTCPDNWDDPTCFAALTQSNNTLSSSYTAKLLLNGQLSQWQIVTDQCAGASSLIISSSAKVMAEAFTICSNAIDNAAQATGIVPDPTAYEVLFYSAQALRGDQAIENLLNERFKDIRGSITTDQPPSDATQIITTPERLEDVSGRVSQYCNRDESEVNTDGTFNDNQAVHECYLAFAGATRYAVHHAMELFPEGVDQSTLNAICIEDLNMIFQKDNPANISIESFRDNIQTKVPACLTEYWTVNTNANIAVEFPTFDYLSELGSKLGAESAPRFK